MDRPRAADLQGHGEIVEGVEVHQALALEAYLQRGAYSDGGPDAVERAIEDNVPVDYALHAHHWLILHGRYTCVARKPRCGSCLIEDLCEFRKKTS